jgi:hypothetical protein
MKISAMANGRAEALSCMSSLGEHARRHIIKLLLAPTNPSANHWSKEITTWLTTISGLRLKSGTGSISTEMLRTADLIEVDIVHVINDLESDMVEPYLHRDVNSREAVKELALVVKPVLGRVLAALGKVLVIAAPAPKDLVYTTLTFALHKELPFLGNNMTQELITVPTRELKGPALDWAVAKVQGAFDLRCAIFDFKARWSYSFCVELIAKNPNRADFEYVNNTAFSTDWSLAGPIIEEEFLSISPMCPDEMEIVWHCTDLTDNGKDYYGETLLIAAMRCYVASKLGDTFELPKLLWESSNDDTN